MKTICVRIVPAAVLMLTATIAAHAEGIQPGYWKVTSAPQINGVAAPPQVKMRCLTPQEASDVDKTFSPEHMTPGATCERTEHEMAGTKLTWRLLCTGTTTMNVAGTFNFDTPQHYSAVVTSEVSVGGQTMASHVLIEGERVGDCP